MYIRDRESLHFLVKVSLTIFHEVWVLYCAISPKIPLMSPEMLPIHYLTKLKFLELYLYFVSFVLCFCRDKGMKHLTKMVDWVDLFDVVVVQARKPKFYFDTYRLVKSSCVCTRTSLSPMELLLKQ